MTTKEVIVDPDGTPTDISGDVTSISIEESFNAAKFCRLGVSNYLAKYSNTVSNDEEIKVIAKDRKFRGYIRKIDAQTPPQIFNLSCYSQIDVLKNDYTGVKTYTNQTGDEIISDILPSYYTTDKVTIMDYTINEIKFNRREKFGAIIDVLEYGDSEGEYVCWDEYDWDNDYSEDWIFITRRRE